MWGNFNFSYIIHSFNYSILYMIMALYIMSLRYRCKQGISSGICSPHEQVMTMQNKKIINYKFVISDSFFCINRDQVRSNQINESQGCINTWGYRVYFYINWHKNASSMRGNLWLTFRYKICLRKTWTTSFINHISTKALNNVLLLPSSTN